MFIATRGARSEVSIARSRVPFPFDTSYRRRANNYRTKGTRGIRAVRRDLQFGGLTRARFVIVSRWGWSPIVLARAPAEVMRQGAKGGKGKRCEGSRVTRGTWDVGDAGGRMEVSTSDLRVLLRPSFVASPYTYRSVLSRYEIAPAAERGAELLNHYSPAHIIVAQ